MVLAAKYFSHPNALPTLEMHAAVFFTMNTGMTTMITG